MNTNCRKHNQLPVAKLILAASTALLFNASTMMPATAATEANVAVQQITSLYNQANYGQAIILADNLVGTDPQNPLFHYVRANALAAGGFTWAAIPEYQKALKLHPTASIADYCTQALNASQGLISQQPTVAPGRKIGQKKAAAISRITNDTNSQTATITSQAQAAGDALEWDSTQFKSSTDRQTMQTIQAMQATGQYVAGAWEPAYSQADYAAVETSATNREQAVSAAAGESEYTGMELANQKASATKDSADNLQMLLSTHGLPGSPKLNPVGTNLFVRNYASNAAIEQPLIAQAGRLPVINPLRAKAGTLNVTRPGAENEAKNEAGNKAGKAQIRTVVTGNVVKR